MKYVHHARRSRDERTGQGGIAIGRESSDPRAPARRSGCGMARWQIPNPVRSHDTVTHRAIELYELATVHVYLPI